MSGCNSTSLLRSSICIWLTAAPSENQIRCNPERLNERATLGSDHMREDPRHFAQEAARRERRDSRTVQAQPPCSSRATHLLQTGFRHRDGGSSGSTGTTHRNFSTGDQGRPTMAILLPSTPCPSWRSRRWSYSAYGCSIASCTRPSPRRRWTRRETKTL
jgi:hypothetical protein